MKIFNVLFFCMLAARMGCAGQTKPHFPIVMETVAQITADTAYVVSPDIDKVWNPDVQYLLIVPQNAGREVCAVLKKALNNPVYTVRNTLILYPLALEEAIKKVNTAYLFFPWPMELFDSDPQQITEASIKDIKSDRTPYRYKIVRRKQDK